jgi:hypothetical protein
VTTMKLSIGQDSELSRRFVLLAPANADTSGFCDVDANVLRHQALLADAQRLRAKVYLDIGAVDQSHLSPDGRHIQDADDKAWHLLTVDGSRVLACARYVLHESTVSYSDLGVRHCALAHSEQWAHKFRLAVESELASAKKRQLSYAEFGGWAISAMLRCSTEALRMVLSFYALSEWFGGVLAISTARGACSAPVLRKMGWQAMAANGVEVPSFFDPEYKCDLEVLRFDSSKPLPKYQSWIQNFLAALPTVPVIAAEQVPSYQFSPCLLGGEMVNCVSAGG